MSRTAAAHPSEDQLVELAGGLLHGEALADLLDHLHRCADCGRRAAAVGRAARRFEQQSWGVPVIGMVPPRRRLIWGATAAIVAAALAAAALFGHAGAPGDPFDRWLPTDELAAARPPAEAGQDPPPAPAAPQGDLDAAVAAYARRDTSAVVALLGSADLPAAGPAYVLLYASALIREGRPAEAMRTLTALDPDRLGPDERDWARWLECAAFAADGRAAESSRCLDAVETARD